jgi:hypothetical protein
LNKTTTLANECSDAPETCLGVGNILGVLATSASTEKLFSKAGLGITDYILRLLQENLKPSSLIAANQEMSESDIGDLIGQERFENICRQSHTTILVFASEILSKNAPNELFLSGTPRSKTEILACE